MAHVHVLKYEERLWVLFSIHTISCRTQMVSLLEIYSRIQIHHIVLLYLFRRNSILDNLFLSKQKFPFLR